MIGIDAIGDLVDTAEMSGYVERTGAWYLLPDGTKVQGREGFIDYVRENEVFAAELRAKLNG